MRLSLRIRVSLLFLKGMWVLLLSMSAEMQCPKQDRLPLMLVSYWMRTSRSCADRSEGILNFSEPARSTTRSELDWKVSVPLGIRSYRIWKIEWERLDLELAWVDPVALFLRPIDR